MDGFLLTRANGNKDLFKVAVSLQLTAKGQPVIYYGEEIGMSGKNAGNMDVGEFSENRYDFDWDAIKDNELLEHYKKLLSIRGDYSKLFARGDRKVLSGDNNIGYSIFSRSYNGETLIIGLNTKEYEQKATFTTNLKVGEVLKDLYNGDSYIVDKNQKITVTLPANEDGGTLVLVESFTKPEEPSKPEEEESIKLENKKPTNFPQKDTTKQSKENLDTSVKVSSKPKTEKFSVPGKVKTPIVSVKKSDTDTGASREKKKVMYQILNHEDTPEELSVEVLTNKQFDKPVYLSIKLDELVKESDIFEAIELDIQNLIMEIIEIYNIEILDEDGKKISHIAEGVEITLTLQKPIEGRLLIYHQKDDGTYEKIPVKSIEGQTVTFIAYDFSPYIFVLVKDEAIEEELNEEDSKEEKKELIKDDVSDNETSKAVDKEVDDSKPENKILVIGLIIVLIIVIILGIIFIINKKR